jgi:hypothetical protein
MMKGRSTAQGTANMLNIHPNLDMLILSPSDPSDYEKYLQVVVAIT